MPKLLRLLADFSHFSPPMLVSLKFISSKSGKSLALKIENKTYLFNLFEGFQRYSIQEQFSLVSIDSIFLTSKNNISGLIGAYLTISESPKTNLNIVSNFNPDFFSVHKYAISPILNLTFLSEFKDEFISVKMFDWEDTTNFIISLPEIKGTLHPERIPPHIPKKLYKKLISDGCLVFEGEMYRFSDFADPGIALNEVCLIFSDINSREQLDAKISRLMESIHCFFCFTKSSYEYISKTYPHSKRCPSIGDELLSGKPLSSSNFSGVFNIIDNNFVEYEDFYLEQKALNQNDCRYLLPFSESQTSTEDENSDAIPILAGDLMIFDKKKGLHLVRKSHQIPDRVGYLPLYPCIEFLGTGCAIPSKHRNVSSILYQSPQSAILMDCGEDTLTQIARLHGSLEVLKKLKIIYISHSHADHILGIASIVKKASRPLLILAPSDVKDYLRYFNIVVTEMEAGESISLEEKITFISTNFLKAKEREFYKRCHIDDVDWNDYVQKIDFEEFSVTLCGCAHSKTSTSASIVDKVAGKSFSYSGDTMPSRLFAFISRHFDVMIHESTFTTNQIEQARKTYHSTRDEAREVFRISKSKTLLLTHFSNRNEMESINEDCVSDFFRYVFD